MGETSKNYSLAAHFKYLGTSIEEEVVWKRKSQSGWRNWKKCSRVRRDKMMPATTKRQEKRIEVNEMKMLRRMCGDHEGTHTRYNKNSACLQNDQGETIELVQRHSNCTSCQQFCRCLYLGSSRQVQAEHLLCSYNANSCRVSMPVKLSVNSYAMNSWYE